MAQHDYDIANQTAPNLRADLNNVLAAIVSQNSGSTAPSSTFANMIWYDTANNILKMRNEADDAWINVAYVNQADNSYAILEGTKIRNTSGTEIGEVGSGGLTLLETQTASASANLDFTAFDNTKYGSYLFKLESVLPATSLSSLILYTSADGGSTFATTSGDYLGYSTQTIESVLIANGVDNTLMGVSGSFELFAPQAGLRTAFCGKTTLYRGSDAEATDVRGARDATTVTDAVRFQFSSGNITSGVIRMYGVLK